MAAKEKAEAISAVLYPNDSTPEGKELRLKQQYFFVAASLQDVLTYAMAYDNPIPGYDTPTTSNLRLWDAQPLAEFDLTAFNAGDYDKAMAAKEKAEAISAVLYPNDSTPEGKELRLKQQYFFVAASLQHSPVETSP
ncbi:alpha-1,4 glucan phosphorylase [Haematococcus lacustris]|uniref:Alpha-1,4 glucan phosphorylase n=1 Tax=Haematococcus lacustris TaxID=44745 RepID=A0A6A0AFW9_HAELA|nr:alpha-1,4 glucan phosphorylase [Haematococcus lacustris]